MSVGGETKRLLLRWQALSKPGGLQRARSMALTLCIFGFIVAIVVAVAIVKGHSPVWVALGGVVVGWIIAETNALRSRIEQWDTFQRYLDWARIEQELKDAA
jgi:hypothetical protein